MESKSVLENRAPTGCSDSAPVLTGSGKAGIDKWRSLAFKGAGRETVCSHMSNLMLHFHCQYRLSIT